MARPFDFDHVGGSIVGRDHMFRNGVLIGRPNQDAMCDAHDPPNHRVFVVCDGCGSSRFSEVGARIGARLTCQVLSEMLRDRPGIIGKWPLGPPDVERVRMFLEGARTTLAGRIDVQARVMADRDDPTSFLNILSDYYMFTIVGLVMAGDVGITFSLGDGYFVVNDEVIQRDSGEDNAPPYLAYDLMPDSVFPDPMDVRRKNQVVFECHDLARIDSIIVATDGLRDILSKVGRGYPGRDDKTIPPVSDLRGDEFFTNPSRLQRELSLMNMERVRVNDGGDLERSPGALSDDTTLYVIRRRRES